jgi:hypothetical protein
MPESEASDNVSLICRAVNCHADLLTALIEMREANAALMRVINAAADVMAEACPRTINSKMLAAVLAGDLDIDDREFVAGIVLGGITACGMYFNARYAINLGHSIDEKIVLGAAKSSAMRGSL